MVGWAARSSLDACRFMRCGGRGGGGVRETGLLGEGRATGCAPAHGHADPDSTLGPSQPRADPFAHSSREPGLGIVQHLWPQFPLTDTLRGE